MGRFPNIAAAKEKTGAAKARIYSMYGREIYQEAKNGGSDPTGNLALRRLIEKARKDQVPNDVIKRALDKVNSGIGENYVKATYELFGPSNSTLIVDCLTDNLNRAISDVKTVVNKCHIKFGAQGSVGYMYDNFCVVAFKDVDEDKLLEAIIERNLDIENYFVENDIQYIYGIPSNLYKIKETVLSVKEVEFIVDEITMLPKDRVTLDEEDLVIFKRVISMLDEVEDVQNIYHNVEM